MSNYGSYASFLFLAAAITSPSVLADTSTTDKNKRDFDLCVAHAQANGLDESHTILSRLAAENHGLSLPTHSINADKDDGSVEHVACYIVKPEVLFPGKN